MRGLFLLDPDIVFLNHGSFGACPAEVLEAQQRWQLEMERNPVEFLARRSGGLLRQSRTRLAAYLGARPEDLVYVSNATTAVNAVAQSLELIAGDEVITTDHEYGACDATWERVCLRAGARYRRVSVPLPLRRDEFADRLLAAAGAHARAIFVSHVTSATALIFPLEELCRKARERGLVTVIDGAHAPGQIPLDLTRVGADFYIGTCHKWLMAPKGAAFLHVQPERHALLQPLVVSWGVYAETYGETIHDSYTGASLLERRLQWQGTRDLSAFLAVPGAIDFQQCHGWEAVRARCHALAVESRERIGAVTGLPPICPEADLGQMAAIPLPACEPETVRRLLFERHRIEVPVITHCGKQFLRVSFQGYNTRSDADALVAAAQELFGRR